MATTRRRGRTASGRSAEAVDDFLGTDNIVPGEVLLTLAPAAADAMTASVPLHPAGPVFGMATELGVSDLDAVLADLGVHDITRLAVPATKRSFGADVFGIAPEEHVLGRTFRVRIAADADVPDAVARLAAVNSVEVAEPNRYRVSQDVTPNDPSFGTQWGLTKINAPAAWAHTTGSASVVVAVIDSGVDLAHPELVGLLVPGYDMVDLGLSPTPPAGFRFEGDFSGRDSVPDDEVGHGTHVAGTIAAASDNGVGVTGVTWQCRIMPIKALTRMVRISDGQVRGVGTSADIAAAVRWAADNGASVVNMSLGSSASTTVESSAIAYAIGKGVVVVAAMGNDGTANPSFPAAYPDVIAVGAIDSTDHRATFSQTGAHIDVVAPGVSVLSTVPGGYGSKSGTSMATPHVAGVAALIRSVKPAATVAEVTTILRSTARALRDNPADPVPSDSYGWGLVDAAAAVAQASPPVLVNTSPAVCQVLPRTTAQVACQVQPRTIVQVACQVPQTIRGCFPRTVVQPECVVVPPRTTPAVCLQRTVPPVCVPIRTVGAGCQPRTLGCVPGGFPGREGAYDPYGYLGVQGGQGVLGDQADQAQQDASDQAANDAWAAGYEAGYLAALEEAGTSPGDDQQSDTASGDWTQAQDWPRTVLVARCLPVATLRCPPPTAWCPVRTPSCPVTITRTPLTTTLPTTTYPTTFPTTAFPTTTNPPTTYGGGPVLGWGAGGVDPYGQALFQG